MKNLFRFSFGLFFIVLLASAAIGQVRIVHTPPNFAVENTPIHITAYLENTSSSTVQMRLYFRALGEESFQYLEMENLGNEFAGVLPPQPQRVQKLQYFLMAIDGGMVVTLPEENPYYEPLEIQITPAETIREEQASKAPISPPAGGKYLTLPKDSFLILSPDPSETYLPNEVIIAVSLFLPSEDLDIDQTSVEVDGRPIVAEVSLNLITATIPQISPGRHLVEIFLRRPDARVYEPIRWQFLVRRSKKELRATSVTLIPGIRGKIYAESKTEKISGRKLDNNQLGGRLQGQQGFLQFGTNFYVTSLEKKNYQPRNRLLIWADLRFLKLYFGDTSPRFSELVLWGKRVRGFDAQLNLGFINFDFVKGQTARAIEATLADCVIDSVTQDTLFINPTTGDTITTNICRYGTFQRDLTGLRVSFGKGHHFQWGLNLLKVKDDINSIQYGLRPKDNLVLGTDILIAGVNNRFWWTTEVAFSMLTDDISGGALSKADIDSTMDTDIPFDPVKYEKYLVLNTSTIPLDPRKLSSIAWTSALRLNFLNNYLTIKYKSIGSAYNSLGNTFIKKNIRGLSIYDRIRLWQNRIYLSLGYEDYWDNFSESDNNPKIHLNTIRCGFNFYPGNKLPVFNFNYRIYQRNNGVDTLLTTLTDTLDNREQNTTSEVSFNCSYNFILFDLEHTFTVNFIQLDKVDAFKETRSSLPIGINNRIQSYSLRTKYKIPLTTTISITTNKNSYLGGLNTLKFSAYELRNQYSAFNDRLIFYSGIRLFEASGGGLGTVIDYKKDQFMLGGRFYIARNQILIFDMSRISFKDHGGTYNAQGEFVKNPSFRDYTFRLRYELNL